MTFKGKHHSEETKRKIKANQLYIGKHRPKEFCEKLKKICNTKEHKEKISRALKGKKRPDVSLRMKGREVTKKTKIKNGIHAKMVNTGRHHTEETKKKISKSNKGKARPDTNHRKLILKQKTLLESIGFRCVDPQKRPRPDIIAIKNCKVYAIEVETGQHIPEWYKYDDCEIDYDDIFWLLREGRQISGIPKKKNIIKI